MKLQKQEAQNEVTSQPIFSFSIDTIHIRVKFACRLYLEYLCAGETRKSEEVRIDQKCKLYKIQQKIIWKRLTGLSTNHNQEQEINIFVKLLSNKGLAFTAGVLNISYKNYINLGEKFSIKLLKSLDFDAYCNCTKIDINKQVRKKLEYSNEKNRPSSPLDNKKESNISSEKEKVKIMPEFSAFNEEIAREGSNKSLINSRNISKTNEKKIRRVESIEDYILRQKELLQKIEELQSQIHKNVVLFAKQKQIISLLDAKQQEFNQQRTQFKTQIKVLELDLEEKRQKIRQLQGEKLKLLMNTLQAEKEVTTSKQKIGSLMEKVYERIKRLFQQKSQKILAYYSQKTPIKQKPKDQLKISLSKISINNGDYKNFHSKYAKQGEQISKVSFSAVRGLINKQMQQGWLQQSEGFRENNPSSVLSNTLNDMSISNINGKVKEVSLLNSDLFLKPQQQEQVTWSLSSSKQFIQQITKGMNKLQSMISAKIQKTIQSFVQIEERNRAMKDNSNTEESLLGYLEQLQTNFERQLILLGQKQRKIAYYQQLIEELNHTLSEKQNLVVQLEEQLFRVEEEKDHIRTELHDANYAHCLKEEDLIKKIHLLQHGRIMPDYSSSASPTHKPQARRKDPKITHAPYQQEIIEFKQRLRMMEIDLMHQRDQRQKLMHDLHCKELQLQETLIEKRRLEFANKLRDRMASLNESIEFSPQEDSPQKISQESLENEQNFLNILIYQQ